MRQKEKAQKEKTKLGHCVKRLKSCITQKTITIGADNGSPKGVGQNDEDDLSQPWLCEENDPFTTRIQNFEVPKRTRMPVNVKTYDGTGDPDDQLKIFQAAAKIERWAMPTWCHMFNSILIGSAWVWFYKLSPESIDNYEMLQKAFLRNYSQQKKYINDPVEIHHIKQREGEPMEAFMERFKAKSMHVSGAPEYMRISGFMHDITNPDLIKKLNDNVPKSVDEMMSVTTAFLREELVAANQSKKKALPAWKHHETGHRPNFDKRLDFKSQHKSSKRQDRFTPLTKTPKEILAIDTVKFKAPPPMTEPAENRNKNKFCEFHRDKGHSTANQRGTPTSCCVVIWIGEVRLPHDVWLFGSKRYAYLMLCGYLDRRAEPWRGVIMVVRSSSPYNGIIGRLDLRKIQAKHMIPRCPENQRPRKESKYNPPRVSGTICYYRRKPIRKRKNGTLKFAKGKPGYICLETGRHGLRSTIHSGKPFERSRRMPTHKAKKEGHAPNRKKAIQEEVIKLVEAEIMREVHYHDWLSNPVMVKKHEDSWRIGGKGIREHEKMLAELPMVTAPKPKEELIIYLCATKEAVSAVLLAERDSRQIPIYFVSRALQTLEINYSSMEKLVLALVNATRRLRIYFQAHPVVVITYQPIKQILTRPENTRRMLKWKFKPKSFDIKYRPMTSIRSQILAEFISEKPDEEVINGSTSLRGNPRTMDPIHGWIIMFRRVRSRTHHQEPRRRGIYLCIKVLIRRV
uniref:Reverse transcriptase domain-containing protein n=1 Tax=Tanacetum cinerariifolium TaxID=118510 RepID=A0A699H1Q3_TANCI|nr:reverse transcriptase domain-containing protein [Tanacetum cinerariifolium]